MARLQGIQWDIEFWYHWCQGLGIGQPLGHSAVSYCSYPVHPYILGNPYPYPLVPLSNGLVSLFGQGVVGGLYLWFYIVCVSGKEDVL